MLHFNQRGWIKFAEKAEDTGGKVDDGTVVVGPPAPHKDDHENTPAKAGGLGGGPYNRVTEAVVSIAENLGAKGNLSTGNRLADALEEIAGKASDLGGGLPEVTDDDLGCFLGVTEKAKGVVEWGIVDPPSELPSVNESDNGKFLGVSSGVWSAVDAPSSGPVIFYAPVDFTNTGTGETGTATTSRKFTGLEAGKIAGINDGDAILCFYSGDSTNRKKYFADEIDWSSSTTYRTGYARFWRKITSAGTTTLQRVTVMFYDWES